MENIQEFIQKELIYAFETSYNKARLYNIAERYGFLDKLEVFSGIIEGTIYGKIPISALSATLTDQLGISDEVAQYINIEIDRELFSEVRNEFNVIQGLTTIEEYEKTLREYAEEEGILISEDVPQKPSDEEPGEVVTQAEPKDPVASSILDGESKPGERVDPYREPIE